MHYEREELQNMPSYQSVNRPHHPVHTSTSTVLTALWVDFSRTSSDTVPLNPDGSLPQRLADHRPDPPRRVDQATILRERPTYYFCYRLILLLYAAAFEYDSRWTPAAELPQQLLPDWGAQRYYDVKYLKPRRLRMPNAPKRVSPIAVSMMKGACMRRYD